VILYLHGANAFGAVEQYVLSIAAGARAGGHDVLIVHSDSPANDAFASLDQLGVRRETFAQELLNGPAPRLLRHLTAVLRRERPELVHVTDVWPVGQVAARLGGPRRVFVTHHTPELPRRDSLAGRTWWALGWLSRPSVIYTSQSDRLRDRRRLLRTQVIALGIDLERFARGRSARAPKGARIGVVARLAEQKGHRYLVDAAPRVLERRPDASFALIGDGELREQLEQLVSARGLAERFEFLGDQSDVPAQLDRLDVVAHPALFEGLCLAVIEAQAAGVPVVATPVGGIGENVVDSVTGLLVPPRDSDALADAIIRLLEKPDEARLFAERAQRHVLARYSESAMVEQTLALYAGASVSGST
jgi:glycosyltransferase involved in cell wall biosynthesis